MNDVSSLNLDRFRPQDQWSGPLGALVVVESVYAFHITSQLLSLCIGCVKYTVFIYPARLS